MEGLLGLAPLWELPFNDGAAPGFRWWLTHCVWSFRRESEGREFGGQLIESWTLFLGTPRRLSGAGCFGMLVVDGLSIPLAMGGLLEVDGFRLLRETPCPDVEDADLEMPNRFLLSFMSTWVKSPSVFLMRRDVSSSSSTWNRRSTIKICGKKVSHCYYK